MRGGEFAQPWGIPVYKTCLSVHWSWLDFCVLPSSFRKVSPPLGFQTRFAIRSLEDCMLHVSECVWHCYHHYQPLTTLSAKWSFQDFVLWTEYINQWVRTGATGLKLCLCGRQLCLSKICFFFLSFFYTVPAIYQLEASEPALRRPVSYQNLSEWFQEA